MNTPAAAVVERIAELMGRFLPDGAALHEPVFKGAEWAYVKNCIDTGWVSTAGDYVERFEEMLTEVTGVGHSAATVTGTAALHACLLAAGVQPGDEVIVPTLTFAATANAVAHCQATPHFADISEADLGVDAERLDRHLTEISETRDGLCLNRRTQRPIRALICVHIFGHACDLDRIAEVAARHKLILIEDAAESLGTLYKGRHTGNHGRLAALSFNGNKIVTTGGGGAVMTNDPALARQVKHLTTTAKLPHPWRYDHDIVGYNYRLPNINAALGCAQLENLQNFIDAKRALAHRYQAAFANVDGVRLLTEPAASRSNYWLNALILDRPLAAKRDELLQRLHDIKILARPAWTLMHQLTPFRDCPRMDLKVAEDMAARIVNLPSGVDVAGHIEAL